MIKKDITYTDFNGVEKTEEWLFNLSDAELLKMELGVEGGSLSEKLKSVQRAVDGKFIMDTFDELLTASVGERSGDGSMFFKDGVARKFKACGAFSALYVEILGDPEKAQAFVNGLVTKEALSKATEAAAAQKAREASEAKMQGHLPPAQPQQSFVQEVQQPPAVQPQMSLTEREELERLRAQLPPAAQAPVQSVELTNEGTHFNPNQQ